MPSISARAASSSTTRTRPRLGPFWGAVGGTAPILRCPARNTAPPGREHPAGWQQNPMERPRPEARAELARGEEDGVLRLSVAVVVALVRALDRDAEVVGLHLGQLGELHAQRVEVQPRDVLVELLGQHGDA